MERERCGDDEHNGLGRHASHPDTLAFLAGVNNVASTTLGVTSFGQSGALEDVYRYHGIDADTIVAAALDLAD